MGGFWWSLEHLQNSSVFIIFCARGDDEMAVFDGFKPANSDEMDRMAVLFGWMGCAGAHISHSNSQTKFEL